MITHTGWPRLSWNEDWAIHLQNFAMEPVDLKYIKSTQISSKNMPHVANSNGTMEIQQLCWEVNFSYFYIFMQQAIWVIRPYFCTRYCFYIKVTYGFLLDYF